MKKKLLSLLFTASCCTYVFGQMPTADFSGNPTTVCEGGQVTWTNLSTGTNGGTNYTWLLPGANWQTSSSQTPGPRTYNNAGVYDVTLIVDNGGTDVDTMYKPGYITVLSGPTVTVSPSAGYICNSGSVTLTASGAISYAWTPAATLSPSTGAVVVASPSNNTQYTAVGTDSYGCTDGQNVWVSVNTGPPPPAGAVSGPTNVCSGESGVIYSVPGVSQPIPIRNWSVPPGATYTVIGTRSISVTFGSTSGQVCCTTSNACGAATPSCATITVDPTPTVGAIGTITGPTTACDNQNGVTYTIAPVANASNYNWTVSGDANIASGQGTNTITVDFGTDNFINVCVEASNSCNTSAQECIGVLVSPNAPAVPGAISGPIAVCNGATGVTYTIPNPAGPDPQHTWSVPSGATITSGQGTRTITVDYGASSGSVCVTATNGCGTSNPTCLAITVDPTPAVGAISTISGPTNICANQSGITYSIPAVANATTYNWTLPAGATVTAGAGTNSITVTFATSGGALCVDASNACSQTSQECINVTVDPSAPAIPGSITGPTTVCSGLTGVAYSVASVPNTTTYTWTLPTGATIASGAGTNNITVDFTTNTGTVCVTAGNSCGTSLASCLSVSVDPTPAVGSITTINGPSVACANQSGVTYIIPAVANATTYNWTVPGGASITSGQGTNTVVVSFGTNGGSICVDAANGCSSTSQACLGVTLDPNAPAIPGAITGLTTVCNGQASVTYSVSSVPNTTTYNWTVPAGATIDSGQGSNMIVVSFGASSGTICVTAGNACGTSLGSCQAITVDPNGPVGSIGVITGPTAVCANQNSVVYSIPNVINATNYNWTVPGTATITAGQGTNTVTVNFGSSGGNICVDADNACSSTQQTCEAITVASSAPAIPGAITGATTVCNGQTNVNYSISSVPNATNYTWTVPAGATVDSGQGTTNVFVNFGATSGTICVTAGNACGTSLGSCQAITVDPTPAVGAIGTINGPTAVCANQSNVMFILPAVANATNYNWTVPSAANITSGQGTNTVTVTFGNVSGNICVIANNSCGASAPSCLNLVVSPNAPAIPSGITGATTVCSGQVSGYSIAPVANATTYNWTVTSGTVTAGQGTTNSTVTWGSTSATVCVTAGNGCGTSLPTCSPVNVNSSVLNVGTSTSMATCSGCCDGSATATPTGGTTPYTYAWNPSAQTTATATGLCGGQDYTVCVTDSMGCVTCQTVNIPFVVGVSALTDNGTVKLYPNPANDHLFIEGTLSVPASVQVNVLNIFGQKALGKVIEVNGYFKESINLQSIPSGVYIIEMRSGDWAKSTRIIRIP